jgi:tetratricopeptide (TPR) repeat protein
VDNYTLYKADIPKAPQSAMLNYYMGLELETTVAGKYEKDSARLRQVRNEGIGYLNRSIAASVKFADAHASLGNSYIMLGQLDSAEVHEQRALELSPASEKTVNNLAYIYYREGKFAQSLQYSGRAIKMNPHYAVPYTNMARCYFQLGKNDSAVKALYDGIAADVTATGTYELLALYYKSLGLNDSVSKYQSLQMKYRN